ncbi:MAG: phosphate/phosphite/phosphonate ABC transporter substrate-binding protein [Deltaproteobacteria bacterium]|nr:MAG: phosphate/phosphite/phosphonate ABC transporter substrate-binding protein [Deltaproteobacteria bacterium]
MKRWIALLLLVLWCLPVGSALAAEQVTCWFAPGKSMDQAKVLTEALSKASGADVKPRVANSYAEILDAFGGKEMNLVYAGSFVQAIIVARKMGTALVQNADGKELYAGVMIYKAEDDPQQILASSPGAIAYAIGASSGESCAKAATGGKASIGVLSHGAAVEALVSGKAKAAMVKDGWWQSNKDKYKGLKVYEVPKVSEKKNPDNVLTASSEVPAALADKIKAAALSNSAAFGQGANIKPFNNSQLNFSLGLMMQGKIDPLSYKW